MVIRARCITDPACVWSWASEPAVRGLMTEFGAGLEWTFTMGGLAREFPPGGLVPQWLEASAETGMPTDPRVWFDGPMSSSYPACMAVKAAAEQAADGGYSYLRALREGIFCHGRKLDTTEALVEEARGAGLAVDRFRVDLGSHAIAESFGSDLEIARDVPPEARDAGKVRCSPAVDQERVPLPTLRFEGEGGEVRWLFGYAAPEDCRDAALAVGAEPSGDRRPGVLDALRRFGRMAVPELAVVCDLPAPRVDSELAQLALEWRVRPVPVLAGRLWEPA